MKIKMIASQLVDGEIDFVSLVRNGANRSPWKIIKMEDATTNMWVGLMPELARLEQRLAGSKSVSKETKMKIKDVTPAMLGGSKTVQKSDADEIRILAITKLRQRLNGLNNQWLDLQGDQTNPLFRKLDADYSIAILKCELELASLRSDQDQIDQSSAFFRRGGTSSRSSATVSDSAYDQRSAALCKAESEIDLSPISTQADFNRINKGSDAVSKIDLSGFIL